jgi:catechol 2,3-dioxygenase-like lactoylglutathione lyase family enzyme
MADQFKLRCSGVCELALLVEDLDRAEAFYAGLLGLPVVERWKDAVWVMAGTRTRIGLWLTTVTPLHEDRGGEHVHYAFQVEESGFDELVEHLRANAQTVHVEVFEDGRGRAAYVTDPDGHVLEFWTWDVAQHLDELAADGVLIR